jgi:Mn-dependent DtxR family transcriptional regulator
MLALIEGNPGVKPANLALLMEVSPSQIHGLAKRLASEGVIERRNGGFHRAARRSTEQQ